jgi:hypothetical protein
MRRTSFTDRYGYAPDMLDAAERGFVLYDPYQSLDAMHAALFARPNVTRLRLPCMGEAIQTRLIEMDILYRIMSLAGSGRLTAEAFYRLARARRDNNVYLRNVLNRLDYLERPYLNILLCRNVNDRRRMPRFRRRLRDLERRAAEGEFRMPPGPALPPDPPHGDDGL